VLSERAYIKGRLEHIGDEVGIKYAHILSKVSNFTVPPAGLLRVTTLADPRQLQVRVPSMLIRSDGLLAQPYPMAHNFEKLLSSARQKYTLDHLAEQKATPQDHTQQRQGEAEGASQEEAQPETRKWVFV
jgi:hypothetical protein